MKRLPRRQLSHYEPSRNEPCLCGSGLKFKRCCQGGYSGDASQKSIELYNTGHYEEALKYSRRHLTWYILCYKAHTIPLLESNIPSGKVLLKVDIEALAERLADIHRCYFRTGRSEEFPATIDILSGIIKDKRWIDKITYFHSLWYLLDKQDRNNSFKALEPIDIDSCNDPEILTLYLDVCPNKILFSRKICLIDTIIDNTQKESYKLQYTTLKGIQYCLVCEFEEGIKIIKEGVDRYRGLEDKNKSTYGETHFAYALDLLGRFSNDQQIIHEAIQHFNKLLDVSRKNSYSSEYIAEILKCLGECNEAICNHVVAIENLEESLKISPLDLTKVFLVCALVNNGNYDRSREILNSINYSLFDDAGFFDFAMSWTLLSASTCSEADLQRSIQYLKQTKNDYPIFIQQRDRWLISLLEIDPVKEGGKLMKLIRSINKYVTLNPNFFGIGIDLNKIVEDLDRASNRK